MKRLLATLAALTLLAGCGGPTSQVKGDNTGGDNTTQTSGASADASKGDDSTQASEAPAEDGITATFKVTATGKASVSWGTTSGVSQDEIKKGSWSKKVKLDSFDAATLSVTSSDFMHSQTVTCEILINGVTKAKNKSKGKMAIATCNTNTVK